jgi:SagB-type dehydrogenase family enzyme
MSIQAPSGALPVYVPHPQLLVYPATITDDRVMVAETDSAQAPLVLRDPRVPLAITVLPDHGTRAEIISGWWNVESLRPIADELWTAFENEGLLVPAEEVPARAAAWRSFGWDEAYRYHASTRDYPFLQMDRRGAFESDDARMAEYIAESPPPAITTTLPSVRSVPLRKIPAEESADALLEAMPLPERRRLGGLALLMDVCFGERTRRPFAVQGDFLRKAVPSGGARHPTEAFLAVFSGFSGDEVEPGVYHYNVEHHRLDLVNEGDHAAAFRHASFDLFDKFHEEPFGLLVFCSLVERAMWRYRDARSARAPFIDIGHTLMAYRTVIRRLGVGGYTYQKFHDREVAGLIGTSIERMPPLFLGTLV